MLLAGLPQINFVQCVCCEIPLVLRSAVERFCDEFSEDAQGKPLPVVHLLYTSSQTSPPCAFRLLLSAMDSLAAVSWAAVEVEVAAANRLKWFAYFLALGLETMAVEVMRLRTCLSCVVSSNFFDYVYEASGSADVDVVDVGQIFCAPDCLKRFALTLHVSALDNCVFDNWSHHPDHPGEDLSDDFGVGDGDFDVGVDDGLDAVSVQLRRVTRTFVSRACRWVQVLLLCELSKCG
mmetsp:Transcript_17723/g.34908  ORF Transcript_17723/g.34908 Transcript_17723/m.34908 type:complete len:235 (+) Transcript_17723:3360-4064(+)